jgi:hypothetical protein
MTWQYLLETRYGKVMIAFSIANRAMMGPRDRKLLEFTVETMPSAINYRPRTACQSPRRYLTFERCPIRSSASTTASVRRCPHGPAILALETAAP